MVDNACREYLFITEFFMVRGTQAQDLFNQIMGRTMGMMMKSLEIYVQDCFDTISLFLCIQLILRYQIMCHKRCVPALDKYGNIIQCSFGIQKLNVFQILGHFAINHLAQVRVLVQIEYSKY